MTPAPWIVSTLVVALLIAWIVSEFRSRRAVRITLGCLAILCSFGVASIVGLLERFNSNAWFGGATKDLIDATVLGLEAGRTDRVLQTYRQLQSDYHPTYENRARYDKLVEEAVGKMKTQDAQPGAAGNSRPASQ